MQWKITVNDTLIWNLWVIPEPISDKHFQDPSSHVYSHRLQRKRARKGMMSASICKTLYGMWCYTLPFGYHPPSKANCYVLLDISLRQDEDLSFTNPMKDYNNNGIIHELPIKYRLKGQVKNQIMRHHIQPVLTGQKRNSFHLVQRWVF